MTGYGKGERFNYRAAHTNVVLYSILTYFGYTTHIPTYHQYSVAYLYQLQMRMTVNGNSTVQKNAKVLRTIM